MTEELSMTQRLKALRDQIKKVGAAPGDAPAIATLEEAILHLGDVPTVDAFLSRKAQQAFPNAVVTRLGESAYRLEQGGGLPLPGDQLGRTPLLLGATFRDAQQAIEVLVKMTAAGKSGERLLGMRLIDEAELAGFIDRNPALASPAPIEMTLSLVAKESGVAAETWKKQLQAGRVKGRKVGKTWVIDRDEMVRYLESRDTRGRQAVKKKGRRVSPAKSA